MKRYLVKVTREVTESAVVEVEAESAEQAETAVFGVLHASSDTEWTLDEGSWNDGESWVSSVTEAT